MLGTETAFKCTIDFYFHFCFRNSRSHKLCLYYGAAVLTTHFTRSDACQWCSGSVNHSPSSSSLLTLFMWHMLRTRLNRSVRAGLFNGLCILLSCGRIAPPRLSLYPDQRFTAVTRIQSRWWRPLYSPECQWKPCQLEPQRQIPREDLIN